MTEIKKCTNNYCKYNIQKECSKEAISINYKGECNECEGITQDFETE